MSCKAPRQNRRRRVGSPSLPASPSINPREGLFFPPTLRIADIDKPATPDQVDIPRTSDPAPAVITPYTPASAPPSDHHSLTADMAAALESLLQVLTTHLSTPHPHPLISLIASPDCPASEIQRLANVTTAGLLATSGSYAAGSTQTVRARCEERDTATCHLSGRASYGECSRILPIGAEDDDDDDRAEDFWRFVALFTCEADTAGFRGSDALTNVWWLSKNVQHYFARGWVCILPDLPLPHASSGVLEYSAMVQFPHGANKAGIAFITHDARGQPIGCEPVTPGRRITLPHPGAFRVHALVSRVGAAKAAAGFPVVLLDGDGGGADSVSCEVGWSSDDDDGIVPGEMLLQTASMALVEYAVQQPRLLQAITAEYEMPMAERSSRMSQQLGRRVEGRKWWMS